jgi:hypothetical protein
MQEILENKANHRAMLTHKAKQKTALVSKRNSNGDLSPLTSDKKPSQSLTYRKVDFETA